MKLFSLHSWDREQGSRKSRKRQNLAHPGQGKQRGGLSKLHHHQLLSRERLWNAHDCYKSRGDDTSVITVSYIHFGQARFPRNHRALSKPYVCVSLIAQAAPYQEESKWLYYKISRIKKGLNYELGTLGF